MCLFSRVNVTPDGGFCFPPLKSEQSPKVLEKQLQGTRYRIAGIIRAQGDYLRPATITDPSRLLKWSTSCWMMMNRAEVHRSESSPAGSGLWALISQNHTANNQSELWFCWSCITVMLIKVFCSSVEIPQQSFPFNFNIQHFNRMLTTCSPSTTCLLTMCWCFIIPY